ncbi:hypothetical protein BDV28DRAFT_148387 [Aspergillus coremiiformis]|uniref:Uncharacterized protein n=1 Tax=Aspergillus coremiiformis TaxID=138285 RepID=A0A5N6Z5W6_9EURO|nr:hypothetical protein BDV28DRAFT_148387 [Aspergillus coremiiformis]
MEEPASQPLETISRVFRRDLEGKLRGDPGLAGSVALPYELRVLAAVTSTLEAEYVLAKKEAMKVLQNAIEKRARQDVLNTDEDMDDIYLRDKQAGKRHLVENHQDVEYLLEVYYTTSDAVVQEAASLMGTIYQTEDNIQSILDVRRNQFMVLEAKIEPPVLGMVMVTLILGWSDMNVIREWAGLCRAGVILSGRHSVHFAIRAPAAAAYPKSAYIKVSYLPVGHRVIDSSIHYARVATSRKHQYYIQLTMTAGFSYQEAGVAGKDEAVLDCQAHVPPGNSPLLSYTLGKHNGWTIDVPSQELHEIVNPGSSTLLAKSLTPKDPLTQNGFVTPEEPRAGLH